VPGSDLLLGRPFALYDVARDATGRPVAIDVVYIVLGRGTAALARCKPAARLDVWGPLVNGFGPPPAGPVAFVAGGIGQTPFLALGRSWLGKAGRGGGDSSPVTAKQRLAPDSAVKSHCDDIDRQTDAMAGTVQGAAPVT